MADNNYDYEIDLLKIFEIIKNKILLLISICLLTCTASFLITKFAIKETFTATSKMIVIQSSETASSGQKYTNSELLASRHLVDTYSQIILSDAVADTVIKNLKDQGYTITNGKYRSSVSVNSANNTEIINIKVTTNDPELSMNISNEIANVFGTKVYEIMKTENVTILSKAKMPTGRSGPSYRKNVTLGGIVGVAICGLYLIISALTDNNIKNEEEVKKIFDYPIIGNIPDIQIDNKKVGGDND